MGRPRLELGTYGEINTQEIDGQWCARARYRDRDGVTLFRGGCGSQLGNDAAGDPSALLRCRAVAGTVVALLAATATAVEPLRDEQDDRLGADA